MLDLSAEFNQEKKKTIFMSVIFYCIILTLITLEYILERTEQENMKIINNFYLDLDSSKSLINKNLFMLFINTNYTRTN